MILFLGVIFGVILTVLFDFKNTSDKRFVKFFKKKESWIPALGNIVIGSGAVISWMIDPTSLAIFGIGDMTFITVMIIGMSAHKLMEGAIKKKTGEGN